MCLATPIRLSTRCLATLTLALPVAPGTYLNTELYPRSGLLLGTRSCSWPNSNNQARVRLAYIYLCICSAKMTYICMVTQCPCVAAALRLLAHTWQTLSTALYVV